MALKLVFLGRLEDQAGMAEMLMPLEDTLSLAQVLSALPGDLAAALQGPKVKLALNGALLGQGAEPLLADGDELAFLPPVSGG